MSTLLPWQHATFDSWMARRDHLPHALLLRGRAGIGKTLFARAFARALLCENLDRKTQEACGTCGACGWYTQGNHPDFRMVEPEVLAPRGDEGGEGKKEPSKQIKIEQFRELQNFLSVGTHRGGQRIVLIRPAEAMNVATANAFLKSLEEPPPHTLFLLVTSNYARLLPTVRSRCQVVELGTPSPAEAQQWLSEQGVANASTALAHAGYAPLDVLEGKESDVPRTRLLERLACRENDPLALTDACAGGELPQVVVWLQKWIYDLAAVKLNEAPRYHPEANEALRRLGAAMPLSALLTYQRRLAQARAVAQHPLNPRLFLEDLFMQYRALQR